ncbi:Mitogen-activated protein kinase kinase kinase [Trichinella pseudospiralis]
MRLCVAIRQREVEAKEKSAAGHIYAGTFGNQVQKIFQTGGEPLERNEQHTLLILVRHLGATSDDDNDNLHIEEKANARIQHLLCRPVCQYSNGLTR